MPCAVDDGVFQLGREFFALLRFGGRQFRQRTARGFRRALEQPQDSGVAVADDKTSGAPRGVEVQSVPDLPGLCDVSAVRGRADYGPAGFVAKLTAGLI